MFYLILDTSGSQGLVAVCQNDKILSEKTIPSSSLSQKLMPTIVESLLEAQITVQNLSFLAVGIGPGSFTGTRIGIVSAKAIAYSLNLPIIEFVSHLAFIPENVSGAFAIITDAKSKLGYVFEGEINDSNELGIQDIKLQPLDELSSFSKPLYSPDESLINSSLGLKVTKLNMPYLIKIILNKHETQAYTSAEDLKALYLKGP